MFPFNKDNETKVTLETEMTPLAEEPPFHILLLGDWSGRESRFITSPPEFRAIEIDRDNFDNVIKKLNVGLKLDFQGNGENVLELSFNELEDFHPDSIFQQVSLFDNLRDIRRRLTNSDSFDAAAQEVRSWFSSDENNVEVKKNQSSDSVTTQQPSSEDLLEQILGKTDETVSAFRSQNAETNELSGFIKNIVKPHLIYTDTAEQSKLLIIIDEVISDLMRKILHHPQFQALEAAWRGLNLLIRRVETDNNLKIYLLDISKNELIADLKSQENLTNSQFNKFFTQNDIQLTGDKSWAMVCGNYTFHLNVEDIAALIRIAKIVAGPGASFISHTNPEIFGLKSFDEADNGNKWVISEDSTENKLWTTLRTQPEAKYLGLAMPRFLIRLPYGEETDQTETFSFEEFKASINHDAYLWTNPIFAVSLLIAQTFSKYAWEISSNILQDIDDLPLHLIKNSSDIKTKPCAEIVMTESNYQRMLEQGIIPLISFRDTDKIRIGRFQSVALPNSPLYGRWQ